MNGISSTMVSMHANALAHPWSAEALRGLDGAVTLYAELRVTGAQHTALLAAIEGHILPLTRAGVAGGPQRPGDRGMR